MKPAIPSKRKVEDYFQSNEYKKVKLDEKTTSEKKSDNSDAEEPTKPPCFLRVKDNSFLMGRQFNEEENQTNINSFVSRNLETQEKLPEKSPKTVSLDSLDDTNSNVCKSEKPEDFNLSVNSLSSEILPDKFEPEEDEIDLLINSGSYTVNKEIGGSSSSSQSIQGENYPMYMDLQDNYLRHVNKNNSKYETYIPQVPVSNTSFSHLKNSEPSFLPKIDNIYSTNIESFESGSFLNKSAQSAHSAKQSHSTPKHIFEKQVDSSFSLDTCNKCHICSIPFYSENDWLSHIQSNEHQTEFQAFKKKLGIPSSFSSDLTFSDGAPTESVKRNQIDEELGNEANVLEPVNYIPINLLKRKMIICGTNKVDPFEMAKEQKLDNHKKSKRKSSVLNNKTKSRLQEDMFENVSDSDLPILFIPYQVKVKTPNNDIKLVLMYLPHFEKETSLKFMKDCWNFPPNSWIGELNEPVKNVVSVSFNNETVVKDREVIVNRVIAPVDSFSAPNQPSSLNSTLKNPPNFHMNDLSENKNAQERLKSNPSDTTRPFINSSDTDTSEELEETEENFLKNLGLRSVSCNDKFRNLKKDELLINSSDPNNKSSQKQIHVKALVTKESLIPVPLPANENEPSHTSNCNAKKLVKKQKALNKPISQIISHKELISSRSSMSPLKFKFNHIIEKAKEKLANKLDSKHVSQKRSKDFTVSSPLPEVMGLHDEKSKDSHELESRVVSKEVSKNSTSSFTISDKKVSEELNSKNEHSSLSNFNASFLSKEKNVLAPDRKESSNKENKKKCLPLSNLELTKLKLELEKTFCLYSSPLKPPKNAYSEVKVNQSLQNFSSSLIIPKIQKSHLELKDEDSTHKSSNLESDVELNKGGNSPKETDNLSPNRKKGSSSENKKRDSSLTNLKLELEKAVRPYSSLLELPKNVSSEVMVNQSIQNSDRSLLIPKIQESHLELKDKNHVIKLNSPKATNLKSDKLNKGKNSSISTAKVSVPENSEKPKLNKQKCFIKASPLEMAGNIIKVIEPKMNEPSDTTCGKVKNQKITKVSLWPPKSSDSKEEENIAGASDDKSKENDTEKQLSESESEMEWNPIDKHSDYIKLLNEDLCDSHIQSVDDCEVKVLNPLVSGSNLSAYIKQLDSKEPPNDSLHNKDDILGSFEDQNQSNTREKSQSISETSSETDDERINNLLEEESLYSYTGYEDLTNEDDLGDFSSSSFESGISSTNVLSDIANDDECDSSESVSDMEANNVYSKLLSDPFSEFE